jgi:hypothetical protein
MYLVCGDGGGVASDVGGVDDDVSGDMVVRRSEDSPEGEWTLGVDDDVDADVFEGETDPGRPVVCAKTERQDASVKDTGWLGCGEMRQVCKCVFGTEDSGGDSIVVCLLVAGGGWFSSNKKPCEGGMEMEGGVDNVDV